MYRAGAPIAQAVKLAIPVSVGKVGSPESPFEWLCQAGDAFLPAHDA
jgi:hypothetical protein